MISIIVLRRNKNSNYVSFLFQIRNGYNVKEVLHAVNFLNIPIINITHKNTFSTITFNLV